LSKIRAVRLSSAEEKLVLDFLKSNPLFDFSTIARMALRQFLEHPKLTFEKSTNRSNKRMKENEL